MCWSFGLQKEGACSILSEPKHYEGSKYHYMVAPGNYIMFLLVTGHIKMSCGLALTSYVQISADVKRHKYVLIWASQVIILAIYCWIFQLNHYPANPFKDYLFGTISIGSIYINCLKRTICLVIGIIQVASRSAIQHHELTSNRVAAKQQEENTNLFSVRQILSIKCDHHTIFSVSPLNLVNWTVEIYGWHAAIRSNGNMVTQSFSQRW